MVVCWSPAARRPRTMPWTRSFRRPRSPRAFVPRNGPRRASEVHLQMAHRLLRDPRPRKRAGRRRDRLGAPLHDRGRASSGSSYAGGRRPAREGQRVEESGQRSSSPASGDSSHAFAGGRAGMPSRVRCAPAGLDDGAARRGQPAEPRPQPLPAGRWAPAYPPRMSPSVAEVPGEPRQPQDAHVPSYSTATALP